MRTTDKLEDTLGKAHSSEFDKFLEKHNDMMLSGDRPFSDHMHKIIKEKGLKQQDIFIKADIPERYGYKLLSEEKRTKQRDIILRLCYAMELSLADTQKILQIYEMPQLYARIPRDAALMIAFNERPGSVIDVNSFLKMNGIEPLRSSGVQE